jgi:putative spermidine/putrescine transport system substrate-binding protein
VLDQSFFNWIYMAALVGGGKMNNVDPAWAKLGGEDEGGHEACASDPTHQQLAAGFQNEEVWISANYSARIAQWAKDGVSVRSSYPKEGAITIIFGAAMPKKARNKDAAYHDLKLAARPEGAGRYSAPRCTRLPPPTPSSAPR